MDINVTLLGQMITFGIFVWFTLKFVWPIIQNVMEERKKKIIEGLDAAKKGHEKLKEAEEQSNIKLQEAKEKYNTMITNAQKYADKIVDDARSEALGERDEIILSGRKQIEQELNKVKIELQKETAELVIIVAEKIIEKNIDLKDQEHILNKFIKKM